MGGASTILNIPEDAKQRAWNEKETKQQDNQSIETICPSCEGTAQRVWLDTSFRYGTGKEAIDIPVSLPVVVCEACEMEFTDAQGEVLQHEALCKHLGIITPREIQELRQRHGLSREEFAGITGIGEATLGRWERGAGIQTRAFDLYLTLLQDNEVFKTLRSLSRIKQAMTQGTTAEHELKLGNKFRKLIPNAQQISDQRNFQLLS